MKTYTVKLLAKLSGISSRTLRFYDEINLFKPKYVGDNKYRYYHESQLIKLQQILFLKELDLPLAEIKHILKEEDLNQIDLLVKNRNKLIAKKLHFEKLIETSKKTILHLRGKHLMAANEFYKGFDIEKQQAHESYLIEKGVTEDEIDSSWKKISKHTIEETGKLEDKCRSITKEFVVCLENADSPESSAAQLVVKKHYLWVCNYWQPNQETYVGLSELYKENNEFNKFYSDFHPDLINYLSQAIKYFALHNLE